MNIRNLKIRALNLRTLKREWWANPKADILAGAVVGLALIPEAIAPYLDGEDRASEQALEQVFESATRRLRH